MRIVRLAALFGSLMLLAATTVSLINRRAENRSDQIARVESAADVLSVAVRANIASTRGAVDLAGIAAASLPEQRPQLATELSAIFEGSEACVGTEVADCTGADLFSISAMGELVTKAAASPDAVVAVDAATQSVLFVHRPTSAGDSVTVVLRVPVDNLIRESTQSTATADGVSIELTAGSRNTTDERFPAAMIDGERTVDTTVGDVFIDGSISIRTMIDGRVGLAGGNPTLYGALLGLGTVLLALAGWTFLAERRMLEVRATTDELTGLANRREFERIAAEAVDLADRHGTSLCVMVVDLNGFKQVNDTLGHQFGDLVLKACSERLIAAVRDTDVVGRWGGDEFVILLPGLQDRTAVRNSAERISRTLSESPVVGDTIMSASIGAAIFPRHGDSFDGLMRAADVAMYGAKTTGVGHRIADTIAAQDDLIGDDLPSSTSGFPDPEPDPLPEPTPIVATDDYEGPDRRRSPVPPPPDTAGGSDDALSSMSERSSLDRLA
ncbi:GGDEF domain-containing protein [Ilumatobacter coccineus]|nr:GGDEF domain-containing protein [Ilumatobacter coccineus]